MGTGHDEQAEIDIIELNNPTERLALLNFPFLLYKLLI